MEWVERKAGKVVEEVVEHVEQGPIEESQPIVDVGFENHHDEDPLEIGPGIVVVGHDGRCKMGLRGSK